MATHKLKAAQYKQLSRSSTLAFQASPLIGRCKPDKETPAYQTRGPNTKMAYNDGARKALHRLAGWRRRRRDIIIGQPRIQLIGGRFLFLQVLQPARRDVGLQIAVFIIIVLLERYGIDCPKNFAMERVRLIQKQLCFRVKRLLANGQPGNLGIDGSLSPRAFVDHIISVGHRIDYRRQGS